MMHSEKTPTRERWLLLAICSSKTEFSTVFLEKISQHIKNTLPDEKDMMKRSRAAEAKAKRIRLMIENGMTAQDILKEIGEI